jgi:hypothetical protein
MSSNVLPECHSCGKKAKLVELTAEDIQRTYPPSISKVCAECRDWYRSAARLEVRYSTEIALRDLALMVIVAFSLLILGSKVISDFHIFLSFGEPRIIFFLTAATSLTGLKMAYSELRRRYGFTHGLAWSLHSRFSMMSISLILSGILAAVFWNFLV